MGIGSVQFGGLASGLDTSALISSILSLEARPIQQLEQRKAQEQSRLSLVGTFEGLVKSLQEKAEELSSLGDLLSYSLSVGTEGVATFTLESATAVEGAHDLTVNSLAKADRYVSGSVPDPTTDLGSGTIQFTQAGTAYNVTIAAGEGSLNEIAGAINDQAGAAVNASVINAGTGSSPSYQLVLSSNETGVDNALTGLTSSVGGLSFSSLTAAANAEVVLDGLTIQRSSNVFSDVLEGISFTVSREGATAATTFQVDVDPQGIQDNLQEFVDTYNDVISFINAQNEFSEEGGAGGQLFGDSLLQTVRRTLESTLFGVTASDIAGDTEGFGTLGLIGIGLDEGGTLSIDSTRLQEKIDANLTLLGNLFISDGKGLFEKLDGVIDGLISSSDLPDDAGTVPGIFEGRRDAIDAIIDRIDDDIERGEARLERLEESLVARFSALEELIGGLNAQGAFLQGGQAFPTAQQ